MLVFNLAGLVQLHACLISEHFGSRFVPDFSLWHWFKCLLVLYQYSPPFFFFCIYTIIDTLQVPELCLFVCLFVLLSFENFKRINTWLFY